MNTSKKTRKATGLLAALAFAAAGGMAQAAVIDYEFAGIVENNAGGELAGIVDVGSILTFTLSLDTDNLDADPAANSYQSTDTSTLSATIVIPLAGDAAVSTTGTTTWNASGTILADLGGGSFLNVPLLIQVVGTGMTADQILPDFSSFSGTFSADLSALGPLLGSVIADPFVSGSIASINGVAAVPVPAAAWLFGSALLGLAGARRTRKANAV